MSARFILFLGIAAHGSALAACSSSVTSSATTTTSTTTSTTTTSTTTTGTGGAGGAGGSSATGGAGGACDPHECVPLRFATNGSDHPLPFVTLDASVSRFIGGIDRYVFDFTWHYDDPGIDDEEEQVVGQMRLMLLDPSIEPGPALAVYDYPSEAPPLEPTVWEHTLFGIGVLHTTLTPVSGFFSVRRSGANFVGGIALALDAATPPGPHVDVSGSYLLPVPP